MSNSLPPWKQPPTQLDRIVAEWRDGLERFERSLDLDELVENPVRKAEALSLLGFQYLVHRRMVRGESLPAPEKLMPLSTCPHTWRIVGEWCQVRYQNEFTGLSKTNGVVYIRALLSKPNTRIASRVLIVDAKARLLASRSAAIWERSSAAAHGVSPLAALESSGQEDPEGERCSFRQSDRGPSELVFDWRDQRKSRQLLEQIEEKIETARVQGNTADLETYLGWKEEVEGCLDYMRSESWHGKPKPIQDKPRAETESIRQAVGIVYKKLQKDGCRLLVKHLKQSITYSQGYWEYRPGADAPAWEA